MRVEHGYDARVAARAAVGAFGADGGQDTKARAVGEGAGAGGQVRGDFDVGGQFDGAVPAVQIVAIKSFKALWVFWVSGAGDRGRRSAGFG